MKTTSLKLNPPLTQRIFKGICKKQRHKVKITSEAKNKIIFYYLVLKGIIRAQKKTLEIRNNLWGSKFKRP